LIIFWFTVAYTVVGDAMFYCFLGVDYSSSVD